MAYEQDIFIKEVIWSLMQPKGTVNSLHDNINLLQKTDEELISSCVEDKTVVTTTVLNIAKIVCSRFVEMGIWLRKGGLKRVRERSQNWNLSVSTCVRMRPDAGKRFYA